MSEISQHKPIIFFLLIVLLVGICKIAMFLLLQSANPNQIFSPDSQSYIQTAQAFLNTGQYDVSPAKPGIPQITIQIIISLMTIIFTYLLAKTLWDHQIIDSVAVLLLALDMPSFTNSQKVLTETLFTWDLTIAVFTGIYALKHTTHAIPLSCLHGTFLALATLIRPITYYIIFSVIFCFIILWKSCFKMKKLIRIAEESGSSITNNDYSIVR